MGSFTAVVTGNTTLATDINQVINGLNGASNVQILVQHTNTNTPILAQLATAPGSDIGTNATKVSGDTKFRIAQYIRGSDGYGGIYAGTGTTTTANLYAYASGWKTDQSLYIAGAITVVGSATMAGVSTTSVSCSGTITATSFSGTATNASSLGGTSASGYAKIAGGTKIYVQSSAPSSPSTGDIWVDTSISL